MGSEPLPLRLVEWNVAMALPRKVELLSALGPGLAVLPETAHPSKTESALRRIGATSVEWVGSNPHKGLSVVAFDGWRLRIDESYDPGYQWVMPVHVTGPAHIRLLAVWDMDLRGSGHESAKQLGSCRASLPHYDEFLTGDADLVILSGDFNNSVCWDAPNKRTRFGDFMDHLEDRGFVSAYHRHHEAERGAETHPTLWWMKNLETTYHIDYTFVSDADAVGGVSVGAHEDWIAHSDHSPMIVDLKFPVGPTDSPNSPEATAASSVAVPEALSAPDKETRPLGNGTVSFPLDPGAVPDMRCGNNSEQRVQLLRPTHVTVRWTKDVIVEVKVLGPQILNDSSLGSRILDHCWRRSAAAGGVDLADLPPDVVTALRSNELVGPAS